MSDIAASDVTLNAWWYVGDLHGKRLVAKDVTITRAAATDGAPASGGDDIPASALGFSEIKYAHNGVLTSGATTLFATCGPSDDGTLLWIKEADASGGAAGSLRAIVVGVPS